MSDVADRAAIVDVQTAYAAAIDARDVEAAVALFTREAVLDYTDVNGPHGEAREVLGWAIEMLNSATVASQHLVTNHRIVLDGDRATCSAQLLNPLLVASGGEQPALFLIGGRYDDELVRTPDGWRIAARLHVTQWSAGPTPATLNAPKGGR